MTTFRIMFFVWNLDLGGAENQTAVLANIAAKHGHDVMVVTANPGGQNWEYLEKQGSIRLNSMFKNRLRGPMRAMALLRVYLSIFRLRKLLHAEQPMIVKSISHLNNLIAWIATRRLRNTKLVWWILQSNYTENTQASVASQISKRISGSVPLAIYNSKAGLDYYKNIGFKCKKQIVITSGIDTQHFHPDLESREKTRTSLGIGKHEKLIGIISRIDTIKGHPIFLEAASILSKKDPSRRFIIVGSGNKQYTHKLRQLANKLNLQNNLIWAGQYADTAPIYNAIDILVSSSYSEGFSTVIGEAMSCGVPCVVTDVGDSSQLVGDTGYVIKPGSANEIVKGVNSLLKLDPSEISSLSLKTRARIKHYFNQQSFYEQTEQALKSLI